MGKLPGGVKVVAAVNMALSLGLAGKGVVDFLAAVGTISPLAAFFAVVQIAVALPFAVIAWGLWLGARWARWATLFWTGLGVALNAVAFFEVGAMPSGWASVLFGLFAVGYLAFDSDVRRAFRQG